MRRDDVIRAIAAAAAAHNGVVFTGNGNNARTLAAVADRPEHFYMVGSMGLCAPLAIGYVSCTKRPVIVVEGDGNALMGLSGLPLVTQVSGRTLIHVVLDNGVYETTGRQRTLSPTVDFLQIARGAGYPDVRAPQDMTTFQQDLKRALMASHPTYLYVHTMLAEQAQHPRVPYHPRQIADRFRSATLPVIRD